MADKRSISKGSNTAAPVSAPQVFNARALPVPFSQPQTPEDYILRGANPFRVWRIARQLTVKMSIAHVATAMGVNRKLYEDFERGQYRGLRDEYVTAFCKFVYITPDKLIGRGPLTPALRNVLIDQALHSRSVLSKERAIYGLRNHCDDAESEIMHERAEQASLPHTKDLIAYLDVLTGQPMQPMMGHMDLTDVASLFLQDRGERIAELRAQSTSSVEKDYIWRDFSECTLRLYGPTMTTKVYDNIRHSMNPTTTSGKQSGFKPDWDIFCNMVRRDPDSLGPTLWDDDGGAQFINGKLLYARGAVDLMLRSYQDYQDCHQRRTKAGALADAMQKHVDVFKAWMGSERGQRTLAYWSDRFEIYSTLGDHRAKNWGNRKALPPYSGPKVP